MLGTGRHFIIAFLSLLHQECGVSSFPTRKDLLVGPCDCKILDDDTDIKGSPSMKKSHVSMDIFRTWGVGAQPHSIAFGGVFTNFTEAIFG